MEIFTQENENSQPVQDFTESYLPGIIDTAEYQRAANDLKMTPGDIRTFSPVQLIEQNDLAHTGNNYPADEKSLLPDAASSQLTSGWQDEVLTMLPEIRDMINREDFASLNTRHETPDLQEIHSVLNDTAAEILRIGSIIDKFEQEYRT